MNDPRMTNNRATNGAFYLKKMTHSCIILAKMIILITLFWQTFIVVRLKLSCCPAVMKLTSQDSEKSGRFLLHTLQIAPQKAYKSHEFTRFVTINERGEGNYAFSVVVSLVCFLLRLYCTGY